MFFVTGSKLLSSYGEEFFSSLEKLVNDHQMKRDREADRIDEIRDEQARLDQELREILEEQESRLHDISLNWTNRDDSFEQKQCQNVFKESESVKGEKDSVLSAGRSNNETNNKVKEDRQDVNSPDTGRKSGIKSDRKVKKDSVKDKRPKWNNDFTGAMSNLSIDETELDIGSSRGLTQGSVSGTHSLSGLKNENVQGSMDSVISQSEPNSELNEVEFWNRNVSKPPKSKKKPSYTPNTFVPNRTLQLRRSGSLNRLTDSKPDQKVSDQSTTGSSKTEEQSREGRTCSGRQEHVRSLSRDRAKLPPKKPAFK